MFREDILWLIPALLIALFQVKIIWARLPKKDFQDTEIPGKYSELDKIKFSYYIAVCYLIFLFQLVFHILDITKVDSAVFIFRIVGYILIFLGFFISLAAIRELGENWSGMDDYRIKKGHKLITSGIYSLVRHPIYLAVLMEITGFELVANSWLLVVFLTAGLLIFQTHIKKEEELLQLKFGNKFLSYKKRTKMLIPYLF